MHFSHFTSAHHRVLVVVALVVATLAETLSISGSSGGAPVAARAAQGTLARWPLGAASGARMHPLAGRSMWIWMLDRSGGGDVDAIARAARAHGISTVLVKGGDSRRRWWQLNRGLVAELHRRGIGVCGWQYVYGTYPITEARVGASIVRTGVDCLVIDAEIEYEGRWRQARRYVHELRRHIGHAFPVGLSTFPYASVHRRFPYQVFLGPGGAQFNLPQVYWRQIGDTPQAALRRTLRENRPFGRPILPVGQSWRVRSPVHIRRFELLARKHGAAGVSYWVWQHTRPHAWRALRASGGLARAPRSIRRHVP